MDKIRRDFRQIYAEGCDMLGSGGGMKFQALPPSPRIVRLREELKDIFYFS